MAIEFECPGCRTRFSLSDSAAGKGARCHHCGQLFRVPKAAANDAPEMGKSDLAALAGGQAVQSPPPPLQLAPEPAPPPPVRTPKGSALNSTIGRAILFAVLMLPALGVAFYYLPKLWNSPGKTGSGGSSGISSILRDSRIELSQRRLSELGKGLIMYSALSSDQYPARSWEDVRNQNLISAEAMQSPGDPSKQYVLTTHYLSGVNNSEAIAAYDPCVYDGNVQPVMLMSTVVVNLSPDEVKRRLASPPPPPPPPTPQVTRTWPTPTVPPTPTPTYTPTPPVPPTPSPSPRIVVVGPPPGTNSMYGTGTKFEKDGVIIMQSSTFTRIYFPREMGLGTTIFSNRTATPFRDADMPLFVAHSKAMSNILKAYEVYHKANPQSLPSSLEELAKSAGVDVSTLQPPDGQCAFVKGVAPSENAILLYFTQPCFGGRAWSLWTHSHASLLENVPAYVAGQAKVRETKKN